MGVLLALFFVGNLDVQIISPILPLLQDDFSITVFLAGFSVTAYSITGAIWALVVGPLSDRFGRIGFLRWGAISFAFASAIAFIASRYEFYLLARLLAGVAGGTFSACIIAQIADMYSYEKRGRAMGYVGAVYSMAAVVGVPLGAIYAASRGWRPIYLVFAAGSLGLALFLRRGLVRSSDETTGISWRKAGFGAAVTAAARSQLREYVQFWREAKTRNGLFLAFAITGTSTSLMTYLGVWLNKDFGLSSATIGLVFFAAGISTVLGSLTGGVLADRIGKMNLVITGSLLVAGIMLTTTWITSVNGIFAFCIAGGLTVALREGPYQALITQLVPSRRRGAYIAMRSTAAKVAMGAAAAISGLLFQLHGYPAVTAFAAACSLAAAVVVHFLIRPFGPEPAARESAPDAAHQAAPADEL